MKLVCQNGAVVRQASEKLGLGPTVILLVYKIEKANSVNHTFVGPQVRPFVDFYLVPFCTVFIDDICAFDSSEIIRGNVGGQRFSSHKFCTKIECHSEPIQGQLHHSASKASIKINLWRFPAKLWIRNFEVVGCARVGLPDGRIG